MNRIDRPLTGSGELDETLRRHFQQTADPTTTHARLGGRVPLVRAAAAHVKGRTAEVEVYRLA